MAVIDCKINPKICSLACSNKDYAIKNFCAFSCFLLVGLLATGCVYARDQITSIKKKKWI